MRILTHGTKWSFTFRPRFRQEENPPATHITSSLCKTHAFRQVLLTALYAVQRYNKRFLRHLLHFKRPISGP
jgi:hypothetical protein